MTKVTWQKRSVLSIAWTAWVCAALLSLFYASQGYESLCLLWEECTQQQRMWAYALYFEIRLPRTLLALLSGASLAAAGVLSQGVFRNALASPSLVGSQSGGVLCAVIAFAWFPVSQAPWMIPLSAILGCLMTHSMVSLALTVKRWMHSGELVLLGLAVHILLGGLSAWVLSGTFYQGEKSLMIIRWLFGSYAYGSWWDVALMCITTTLGGLLCWKIVRPLDVYALGEDVARSLSVRTSLLRHRSLGAISLWVGGSVASSGGIPFVGLVAPHLARLLVGPHHRTLLVLSVLIGSTLTLVSDVLARSVRYPEETEVGILLTLFGGIFFLALLLRPGTLSGRLS